VKKQFSPFKITFLKAGIERFSLVFSLYVCLIAVYIPFISLFTTLS